MSDKTPSGAKLIDILRVIRSETQPIDGHPDPGAITDCWNEVFETISAIESKHTDQTEVQRLRAALELCRHTLKNGYFQDELILRNALKAIDQALSTTTEPTVGVGINEPEGDQP